MNPLEEYEQERAKVASDRTKKEQELVFRWKENPTQENTGAVLQQFAPVFRSHMNAHKAPQTNAAGLHLSMVNLAVDALNTYDPSRGATFSTHLHNQLRRVSRVNKKRQNMAKIPEAPAGYIGRIQAAKEELAEETGEEPSYAQIAQRMNFALPAHRQQTAQQVQNIFGMQRRDVTSTAFESDPVPTAMQREHEVIPLLRYNLTPAAQQIFDLMFPPPGVQPITDTTGLSNSTRFSQSKVSRLKNEIIDKFKKYR